MCVCVCVSLFFLISERRPAEAISVSMLEFWKNICSPPSAKGFGKNGGSPCLFLSFFSLCFVLGGNGVGLREREEQRVSTVGKQNTFCFGWCIFVAFSVRLLSFRFSFRLVLYLFVPPSRGCFFFALFDLFSGGFSTVARMLSFSLLSLGLHIGDRLWTDVMNS